MKKVLIISDDKQLVTDLRGHLSGGTFLLDILPGQDEIITEIASVKPDLLLIDFLLNTANGGTLAHQVRANKDVHYLPIVLLSDYPNVEQFTAKFGCNAIIRKPVTPNELVDALSVLLEHPELAPQFFSNAS